MESGVSRKLASPPSYIQHKTNHSQFLLSEMPQDLRDALTEYDVDGDGIVTVAEIAAGAHLLRKQADKVRAAHLGGGFGVARAACCARCRACWCGTCSQ
jgi:hypothetical protein